MEFQLERDGLQALVSIFESDIVELSIEIDETLSTMVEQKNGQLYQDVHNRYMYLKRKDELLKTVRDDIVAAIQKLEQFS